GYDGPNTSWFYRHTSIRKPGAVCRNRKTADRHTFRHLFIGRYVVVPPHGTRAVSGRDTGANWIHQRRATTRTVESRARSGEGDCAPEVDLGCRSCEATTNGARTSRGGSSLPRKI